MYTEKQEKELRDTISFMKKLSQKRKRKKKIILNDEQTHMQNFQRKIGNLMTSLKSVQDQKSKYLQELTLILEFEKSRIDVFGD